MIALPRCPRRCWPCSGWSQSRPRSSSLEVAVSSLALCNAATGTRFSRCTEENIYFSGELINSNQSLTTIQRTHTKIKNHVNTKLEWRHRDLFDLSSYRSTQMKLILLWYPIQLNNNSHHWQYSIRSQATNNGKRMLLTIRMIYSWTSRIFVESYLCLKISIRDN